MLTAYFDESMQSKNDGFVVVAGFMGKKSEWVRCVRTWRRVLKDHGRLSIHLKDLRIKNRHAKLLAELGAVPQACGLRLIFGCVDVSSYQTLTAGKVIDVYATGYLFAYQKALISAMRSVPKGQRLEVICEQQGVYAARRENLHTSISLDVRYHDKHGRSALAKWSSIPKSTVLEPSDYAAFALFQRLVNPTSPKALLCAPILKNTRMRGSLPGDVDRKILEAVMKDDPATADAFLDLDHKKNFIKQMPTGLAFKKDLSDFLEANPDRKTW